jgi:cytochrome b pre-mRNA-processing protein 3
MRAQYAQSGLGASAARQMDDSMALKALKNWFGGKDDAAGVRLLYEAIIAEARLPHWYIEGHVADSIDGRFDMVNVVLALVLIRMEALGHEADVPSSLLAESFVTDMDGQLRELGIGDIVVGKHIGRMMGALGGRLGAYREGFGAGGDPRDALLRNVYRGQTPDVRALDHVVAALALLSEKLSAVSLSRLLEGKLEP